MAWVIQTITLMLEEYHSMSAAEKEVWWQDKYLGD